MFLKGVLVDLDLKSCYGEGQRNQLYPFGRPLIIDYERDSSCNEYLSLRAFLALMRWGTPMCELVAGLWHARVSVPPDTTLEHGQDFLGSWFDYTIKEINVEPDEPHIENLDGVLEELDVHTGRLKVLSHDIQDAVITHDFVQWLDYIASVPQRNELLDTLYVRAALLYPASERVDSVEALKHARATHQGKNRCLLDREKGLLTKNDKNQECYAWYAVNLGEFIIEKLLINRLSSPKDHPLNAMFKLSVNTLFGDMVSPYFKTSNSTVANNITGRARAACWYMEQGLNTIQSITDGGVFSLNHVVWPVSATTPVTSKRLYRLYKHQTDAEREKYARIRFAPLGGYDRITLEWRESVLILHCHAGETVMTREGQEALSWINTAAMEHLQQIFPHVDVLHASSTRLQVDTANGTVHVSHSPRLGQFQFEAKNLYHTGCFHGSSNYRLVGAEHPKIAMRSYAQKSQFTTVWEDKKIVLGTRYKTHTLPEVFLASLESGEPIPRASVFVKDRILKPTDYVRHYTSRYKHSPLMPGDNMLTAGLLREFSPAQFTYCTVDQFKAIERQYTRCKNRFGQYIEAYFLTEKGLLDYHHMVRVVDELITSGSMDLLADLDKHDNVFRSQADRRNHQEFMTFKETKSLVARLQHLPVTKSPPTDEE